MEKPQLIIKHEDLLNSPSDWHDFITFVVAKNTDGQYGEGEIPLLLIFDDTVTEKFLHFLKQDPLRLYVKGHPTLKTEDNKIPIWEIMVLHGNEDQRLYLGGSHLRAFLDYNNIFYKSHTIEDGKLLSVTDGLYLKKKGDE